MWKKKQIVRRRKRKEEEREKKPQERKKLGEQPNLNTRIQKKIEHKGNFPAKMTKRKVPSYSHKTRQITPKQMRPLILI